MKKSILFFAAIAALLSCSKENPATDNLPAETYSVTIEASAPEASDETGTKTTLVNDELVHWTKGDAIKVLFFPNHDHNSSFSGSAGTFESTFDAETSSQANFRCDTWAWGFEQDLVLSRLKDGIALYPSTSVATSSKSSGTGTAINTELYYDLKSTQDAIDGNIESGLNFSYTTVGIEGFYNAVKNSTSLHLSFNNACAIIKVTMPESLDNDVTSLTITSADKKPLTGKGNVDLNYYNDELMDNTSFSVTAEGEAGVTLQKADGSSLEAGETYYAVVWPGEHSALTFTFNAADETVATKTTKAVALTASHIKPYTISSLVFEEPVADVSSHTYYYADGTTGTDVKDNIVGVIFFHGDPSEVMNDPDLPEAYCNGLAISLNDYTTTWGGSGALTGLPETTKIASSTSSYTTGGYTVKKIYTDAGFELPIYTNSSYPALPASTSGWYLPVMNEWTVLLNALGTINEHLESANATNIYLGKGGTAKNYGYWLPLWCGSYGVRVHGGYYGTTLTYDTSSVWTILASLRLVQSSHSNPIRD